MARIINEGAVYQFGVTVDDALAPAIFVDPEGGDATAAHLTALEYATAAYPGQRVRIVSSRSVPLSGVPDPLISFGRPEPDAPSA